MSLLEAGSFLSFYWGRRMVSLLQILSRIFLWLFLGGLAVHTLVRIIRYFVKFPIPSALVRLIDNPLRRKIQSPEDLSEFLAARPDMRILEVGPGNGAYTYAVHGSLDDEGMIVALDIERRVVSRLKAGLDTSGAHKVLPLVADVHRLPFPRQTFDAAFMVAVIGEIPGADAALHAFWNVLKPGSKLMISELLLDPDFTLPRTLRRWAQGAGFICADQRGNMLSYAIIFKRPV
jgi:SAM-dependent methyltransferase